MIIYVNKWWGDHYPSCGDPDVIATSTNEICIWQGYATASHCRCPRSFPHSSPTWLTLTPEVSNRQKEQFIQQLATVSRWLQTFWTVDQELWFAQVDQDSYREASPHKRQDFARLSRLCRLQRRRKWETMSFPRQTKSPMNISRKSWSGEPLRQNSDGCSNWSRLRGSETASHRSSSDAWHSFWGVQSSTRDSSIVHELFLQCLPSNMLKILATSNNIPLDNLAELAYMILDTAPPMIQATTYTTSGH